MKTAPTSQISLLAFLRSDISFQRPGAVGSGCRQLQPGVDSVKSSFTTGTRAGQLEARRLAAAAKRHRLRERPGPGQYASSRPISRRPSGEKVCVVRAVKTSIAFACSAFADNRHTPTGRMRSRTLRASTTFTTRTG